MSGNNVGKQIPLPEKFDVYDVNADGRITLEELAKATNVREHAKGTEMAFNEADKNHDGQIDCAEFTKAPYLFAHRPTCNH